MLYKRGTTRNLGTLGGTESHAFGINSAGQVVGQSTNSSGAWRAFLYTSGAMKDLNTLIASGTGWTITEVRNARNSSTVTPRTSWPL